MHSRARPGEGRSKMSRKVSSWNFALSRARIRICSVSGKMGPRLFTATRRGAITIHKPGQARLVKAGSNIIFQLHYQSNGTEATDQTRIGFVFAKEPPTEKITAI